MPQIDLDALSGGSLAGHLLECGPQSTGGLLTDWESLDSWEDLGYPIAECASDGSFVLTKAANTGGLVDTASVAEQLVYEIGDPAAYMTPDVVLDVREVKLDEVGGDDQDPMGVLVRGDHSAVGQNVQIAHAVEIIRLTLEFLLNLEFRRQP